jgi:hypothetical protein
VYCKPDGMPAATTRVLCQLAFLTRIYLLVRNTTQVPSDDTSLVEYEKAGAMKTA